MNKWMNASYANVDRDDTTEEIGEKHAAKYMLNEILPKYW